MKALVIVTPDFTSSFALRLAADLVGPDGGLDAVHLLDVTRMGSGWGWAAYSWVKEMSAEARSQIESLVKLEVGAVPTNVAVQTGDLLKHLRKQLREAPPDLVVAGGHVIGGGQSFAIHELLELIQFSPRPVLAARAYSGSLDRALLVGDEHAAAAARFLSRLAGTRKMKIQAVEVEGGGEIAGAALKSLGLEKPTARLDALPPAGEVLGERYDLLVCGAPGDGKLKTHLQEFMHETLLPVLFVKNED